MNSLSSMDDIINATEFVGQSSGLFVTFLDDLLWIGLIFKLF